MTNIDHEAYITIPKLSQITGVPENVWRRMITDHRLVALYTGTDVRRGVYYVRLRDAQAALAMVQTGGAQ